MKVSGIEIFVVAVIVIVFILSIVFTMNYSELKQKSTCASHGYEVYSLYYCKKTQNGTITIIHRDSLR